MNSLFSAYSIAMISKIYKTIEKMKSIEQRLL